MARAVRRAGLGAVALPGLVALSTVLHWLAGRRLPGLWIMPDEAIYARRAVELWRDGSLPLLHGQGAGYGVLYPMLAGFPLSVGSFAQGYASLKLLQALAVSLAAVPVFAYARRAMPAPYAFLAATLTVASPLLLYSGLVMTEVLFYPVAALTLLAVARAVETATRRDQVVALALVAVAVLTRAQAVVFVGVFGLAVLLDAALARDRSRLSRFWPVWSVLVVGGAVGLAVPGLFGSYAGTLRGSYPLGDALGLVLDHLAYAALTTGVLPAVALLLLLVRPPRDARGRALVAVTAAAVALVVVQVGFFAARFAPHLLGRDLASLTPLLFVVFALWLARGAPRGLAVSAACGFAVLCLLLLVPWDRLVAANALPDSFGVALLYRFQSSGPANLVAVTAVVLVAAVVVLPRRSVAALTGVALALLVGNSVVASNLIAASVATEQANIVGPTPNWIDRAATGRVTYVYTGETSWNSVWQETFWNRRVRDVVAIKPAVVPGPMPQRRVGLPPSGRLPIRDRYVVASDRLTFAGTPVAHLAQSGLDVSGLTLWQLSGPARLETVRNNVLPNGDMVGPATFDVYGCGRGTLELTLLPKAARVVRVLLDGRPVLRADVAGQEVWHGSVPVRRPRAGRCRFTIAGDGLLGSTRIAFVR